ncbi:TAXI family TRAP transporter solute-binding subunit, partial [Thermodesulfobacteriota bacterium]
KRWIERIGIMLVVLSFTVGVALAEVPRSATLATHAVGSLYNAMGTGLATVLSRNTPMTVRVQPFAGPPAWIPSMNRGETDMGVVTGADAIMANKGIVLYKRSFKNVRLLIIGGALHTGFYVRKDSPIKSISDLKGKRIPTDFPGTPILKLSSSAGLATAGLTYDDIVKVPVADLMAGSRAFIEGRTDACWHAIRSPAVKEANARVGGIRFISLVTTPEAVNEMREIYPGSYPFIIKKGKGTGILADTVVMANDVYLVVSKDFSEEAAYTAAKALWEQNKELGEAYGALRAWRTKFMVKKSALIPYHPGAIKFFREKGAWDEKMDALQAKLLAQ